MKRSIMRLFRVALSAGGTFFIACAYGPVDEGGPLVSGRVLHNGTGLTDLNVCATIDEIDYCARSQAGGAYDLLALPEVLQSATAGFTLCAEDDLGVTGGAVVKTCETVPAGPTPFTMDLEMDEPQL
ncbi:hypothetical protein KJ975_06115 [Myxococcota bacterium]|nr:hypothetical protein [Myxococcota bacterium]